MTGIVPVYIIAQMLHEGFSVKLVRILEVKFQTCKLLKTVSLSTIAETSFDGTELQSYEQKSKPGEKFKSHHMSITFSL